MHTVYYILISVAFFGIVINCQGGGGHGGSGSVGIVGGYRGGSGSGCTTDECQRNSGIIAGSIIGGIFVIIFGVIGIMCCCKRCTGRPFSKNTVFVNTENTKQLKQETYDVKAFQSGIWSSRYFQYGIWHGPHQLAFSFDLQSLKITGSGSDDVGKFTIDGTFSNQTYRIGLNKQYQAGTGDPLQNLGHQVIIQLPWNVENNQFEGKWYVQTEKYHGEDKFELKFQRQSEESIGSEKV